MCLGLKVVVLNVSMPGHDQYALCAGGRIRVHAWWLSVEAKLSRAMKAFKKS